MRIAFALALALASCASVSRPTEPPGRFIDIGGWSQYIHCVGRGRPTVVVEAGLGDFAMDWQRVQEAARSRVRICAYDRAGYGFSDAGPMPRTYDQINLDLHRLLHAAGERGPFVLVGHSFGGPLVRHYAELYPDEVAGIVLLESAHEDQRIYYGGAPHLLREGYQSGREAPQPQTSMTPAPRAARFGDGDAASVDALYAPLTPQEHAWRAWAEARPEFAAARDSETTWSPDYLQAMHDHAGDRTLGDIPLLVITRREGGYEDRPGAPAAGMEAERVAQQAALARLSTRSRHVVAEIDHNPNLSDPAFVAAQLAVFAAQARARN